jgi:predicted DsbA family dithiol-disulfide isomerase
MAEQSFSLTYDYRCPFARNVHEHVIAALAAGAPWDVEFVPFSLSQAHVEEGGVAVWDDPTKAPDLLAVEAALVVGERYPDRFADVHIAFFTARHDEGRDLRDKAVIGDILTAAGVDAEEVFTEVSQLWPREAFRKAHEAAVADHHVFGVPTFITANNAVFARIMTRPRGDGDAARQVIEHVLALTEEHPELNEFKHTSISR